MPQSDFTRKLLNIEDKNIVIDEKIEEIKVGKESIKRLYGTLTYQPKACPNCGVVNQSSRDIIKYGFKSSDISINPINLQKTVLRLKKQRFLCKHCQQTFIAQTGLVDKNCFISKQTKQAVFMELAEVQAMSLIAKRFHISAHTVERVLKSAGDQLKNKLIYLPKHISIDEFKSVKNVTGAMSFIFIDALTHRLMDVVEDRKIAGLRSYFLRFPKESRFAVETVCMDMYSPYISLIEGIFPNATIIIDRFHIIQYINRALNSYRVHVMKDIKTTRPTDYTKLKKLWKLMLKNEWTLDFTIFKTHRLFSGYVTEKRMVQYMCAINPRLETAYKLANAAKYAISNHDFSSFKQVLIQSKKFTLPRQIRTMFNTLIKYQEGIKQACTYTLSNGPIEGINNKIKNIKRSGYGYRNFENLKARTFICFKIKPKSIVKKELYYENLA